MKKILFDRMLHGDDGEGGWTFVEMLVVIGIILILTASVGFMAFRYLDKAKTVTAKSQIETFSLALDGYYIDCGQYPTQEQGLVSLWETPALEPVPEHWNGPYITKAIPLDPWGCAYEYTVPGRNGLPFGIRSFGADKSEGGTGINGDLSTWE